MPVFKWQTRDEENVEIEIEREGRKSVINGIDKFLALN